MLNNVPRAPIGSPCCVLEQDKFTPPQKKVLVIPWKRWLRPKMTEKLFTGTLSIKPNQKQRTSSFIYSLVFRLPYGFLAVVTSGSTGFDVDVYRQYCSVEVGNIRDESQSTSWMFYTKSSDVTIIKFWSQRRQLHEKQYVETVV